MEEISSRRLGTNPLKETRAEAEAKVNKKNHYLYIIDILNDFNKPMTAKELSVEMFIRGYSKSDERNVAAPRITEMLKMGLLDCVGTKKCKYTGNNVGAFVVRNK